MCSFKGEGEGKEGGGKKWIEFGVNPSERVKILISHPKYVVAASHGSVKLRQEEWFLQNWVEGEGLNV